MYMFVWLLSNLRLRGPVEVCRKTDKHTITYHHLHGFTRNHLYTYIYFSDRLTMKMS